MLKFSAKDLKPVLLEARKNHCGVVLVKDHGVYIMSETGELTRKRTPRAVLTGMCYSVGCMMRQGSSSLTRLTGQSAMTSST
ncbi:DUF3085 domain-containing protein [Salmonella enterica]|nr:DUF3085 domain-containing protein [Salmonella enterica]EJG4203680.1 DUF3085 domain-containing protein [Salmonella enterica]EKK9982858.1 DUF3085 domain-containing protein [Salmonella enterica]